MIYKNSNGFYYYDFMLNGIRYSKSTRTKYKKLAMELEDATRSEVLRRGYLPKRFGENKRFFDLCEKYFLEIPEKSRKVIESNLNGLKAYFGDRLLTEISPSLVNQYKQDLRAKGLSVARVNHLLGTIKRMFTLAHEQYEWIQENKIQKVQLLPGANKRIRILSDEEESKLLPACPVWLKELVEFDLLSGFRLAECLSINVKDVDFTNRLLTVWEVKGGGSRSIPISHSLETFLREKMKVVNISGRLFPYSSGQVEWNLNKVCKEIGIENFHFHDCRHTVTTRLLRAGANPLRVKEFMGWRSLAMLERYAHLTVEDSRAVAEMLG